MMINLSMPYGLLLDRARREYGASTEAAKADTLDLIIQGLEKEVRGQAMTQAEQEAFFLWFLRCETAPWLS